MKNSWRHKFFAIAVALVLGLGPLCLAPRAYAQDAPADQRSQLLKKIIELLESTAEDAKKWDDKAVAARTQAQIADLIWDQDRDNAREFLKAAWSAAAKVVEPKRARSVVVNPSVRNSVRREVLLVARKRAPELAATWLDEMVEESKSAEKPDRGAFDDRSARSAVLLQMANEIVADNPKGAAELLIESLHDGVSFNLQTALLRLQQKDVGLSERVFRAALARLRTSGMSDPNELLTLYAYLYTPGRVFAANTSDNRHELQLAIGGPSVSRRAGELNPSMAREFLEVAADVLLSTPLPEGANAQVSARSLVSTMSVLSREITEQLPDKAALLRARAQQLDAEAQFSTTPAQRKPDIPEVRPGESRESFADRRVDLLEETAAKGRDVLTRDVGYATAAVATTVQRYERGLDLAAKIDDKNLREGVRGWLIYRAVLYLITSGKLDEAQRLNLKNDDLAQRAVCFIVGAQQLVKDKDNVRASEWLREAGVLVKRIEPNEGSTRLALGMVSTYGSFDTQAAFDWLVVAVKLMRKTPPGSLSTDDGSLVKDQAPALKRVSGITPISDFTSKTSGFGLQSAIAVFPPDQFEQILSVLNDVTPPEARGLALLTLCRTFLTTSTNAKTATHSVRIGLDLADYTEW